MERVKILVVDDEPANLDLIVRMLRRKYEVVTASSGPEGLDRLREDRFAAVLSDQRMPNMTGTQFLAEASRIVPETVRMILTGYAPEKESMDAINLARVTSFLTKPVAPETVERAVAEAVEAHQAAVRNQSLRQRLAERELEQVELRRQLGLSRSEREEYLLGQIARLEQLALRDTLTGLYNRRYLEQRLAEETGRVRRYGGVCALILASVDHYDIFIEAKGIEEGDKLVAKIAYLMSGGATGPIRLRSSDFVARYSASVFALLVPGTGKPGAAAVCARIRQALRTATFSGLESLPGGCVTMSFGVADAPEDAANQPRLFDAAERALARAELGGRDRIELG